MENITLNRLNHYSQFAALVLAACAVYVAIAVVILVDISDRTWVANILFLLLVAAIFSIIYLAYRNFIDVANCYAHMEKEGGAQEGAPFSLGPWYTEYISDITLRSNILWVPNGIAVILITVYFGLRLLFPGFLIVATGVEKPDIKQQVCCEIAERKRFDGGARSRVIMQSYGECLGIVSEYTKTPMAYQSYCVDLAIAAIKADSEN